MSKDTGGPAFPQPDVITNEFHSAYNTDRGMTLRDYFAAHAPKCPDDFCKRYATGSVIPEDPVDREVRWRKAYADAMLAERNN